MYRCIIVVKTLLFWLYLFKYIISLINLIIYYINYCFLHSLFYLWLLFYYYINYLYDKILLFLFYIMSIIVCFINYFNYLTYFFVLMCINEIIAIIYCGLNCSSKQAYGVRFWVSSPEIIRRHSRQLSQQKYCQSLVMCAPPFRPTTHRKRCGAPPLPLRR